MASLAMDCLGSPCWLFILSPRTWPNVFAYRPDYMFLAVIGISEVIPLNCVKLKTYRMDH